MIRQLLCLFGHRWEPRSALGLSVFRTIRLVKCQRCGYEDAIDTDPVATQAERDRIERVGAECSAEWERQYRLKHGRLHDARMAEDHE